MNIVIDCRSLQDKNWTGVSEYTYNLITSLATLAPSKPTAFLNSFKPPRLLRPIHHSANVVNLHWPSKLVNLFWKFGLGLGADKYLKLKPTDVFWLTNPHFIKLSSSVKKVITLHDLSFIHFPHFFSLKKKLWYVPEVKKLIKNIDNFDLVFCDSEYTRQDLLMMAPHMAPRVKVGYPGLDEVYMTAVAAEIGQSVRLKHQLPAKFILSVGTVELRKNHLTLLKAFDFLCADNNFVHDLAIVGQLGWGCRATLKYWRTMKHKDRVHWLNYIPKEDMPAIYTAADLFLYPSFYEGFGFPVLEAMSQGVKTIISSTSSLPEVANHHSVLANPWRVDEWISAITSCLNNHDNIDLNMAQAHARSFKWDDSARIMYNYIKQL